jgi:hypothetical protein
MKFLLLLFCLPALGQVSCLDLNDPQKTGVMPVQQPHESGGALTAFLIGFLAAAPFVFKSRRD